MCAGLASDKTFVILAPKQIHPDGHFFPCSQHTNVIRRGKKAYKFSANGNGPTGEPWPPSVEEQLPAQNFLHVTNASLVCDELPGPSTFKTNIMMTAF